MRFNLTGPISALLLAGLAACSPAPDVPATDFASLDTDIQALMASEDVKGLAYAVIEHGEVAHVAAFGYRNVEAALPLETDTIMYGASLTKAAFAYMVMQLVDEGLIDLDATIDTYLPRPLPEYEDWTSLADDPEWQLLTPRMILTHSTGLANLRFLEPDGLLDFHREPGTQYGYSGEGFYILQLVLEEGLGLDVKAEMQTRVFDRFGMPDTSMQWRADFADNLADGYAMDGTFEPHDRRDWVSASGSMDTTIADQARMWAGLVRGEGLSAEARAERIRPQLAVHSGSQFPSLTETVDDRGPAIGLSAALGVETYQDGSGTWWSKSGHNPWTGNQAICHQETQHCIVLLGNSVRAELIYPQIVQLAMGTNPAPWWWIQPEYSAH
ncbi:serine hydrolase domain-containing protein [Maricaulis sp.]|uniref:serine hydrolase domain-containing protein n=1 Tax=Maricaulis sp. TaxID=1486257 RepID=UPI003A927D5F